MKDFTTAMGKETQDFCVDCSSRRGFLRKGVKGSAIAALVGVGILGGDRWVQKQTTPDYRDADHEDIRTFLEDAKHAPSWRAQMSPEDITALDNGDVEHFRSMVRVPVADPGQAGAICNYCYCYQYLSRASTSCPDGSSCWCYPKCYSATCVVFYRDPYRVHCGAC